MEDQQYEPNSETPEVLLFLFLKGKDHDGAEFTVRRALTGWSRTYYLAVFNVDKFPGIASRYDVSNTPTLVLDDLVGGHRRHFVGSLEEVEIGRFLTAAPTT